MTHQRRRRAVFIGACVTALCFGLLVDAPQVRAQTMAEPPAKDAIFARKTVMGAIDSNMDEVETMLSPEGKIDSAELREHTDNISILLMAFPHMFAPSTNLWKPNVQRDPATDTSASPEIWTHFDDFYKRATAASKLALDAHQAKKLDEFRSLIAQLRAACNGCHAAYTKPDQ